MTSKGQSLSLRISLLKINKHGDCILVKMLITNSRGRVECIFKTLDLL